MVRGEIRVIRSDGVHHAQSNHEATEGAEDTEPAADPTLGIGVAIDVCGGNTARGCKVTATVGEGRSGNGTGGRV